MMQRTSSRLTVALVISVLGCQNNSPSTGRSGTVEAASTSTAPPPRLVPSSTKRPATPKVWTWNFELHAVDQPPAGFWSHRTGHGTPGKWLIVADDGRRVLAQLDADATNFRFPVAVAEKPELRDVRVSVRCKPVSGKVDQACGLVARYIDANNYYVTRANALEGNVRLYVVKAGKREQLADSTASISANTWHELRLEVRSDHLQVFWDGNRVIDHRDVTFPHAGRLGVWTKADSVTYFDDLTVEGL